MRPDTRRKGSPPTVALCAVRQRQVDPLREDHSLAVWRLGAHLARCCPDVPVRILDLKHDQVEEAFEKIAADPPHLLGISCNVWNVRSLERAAAKVKAARPDVLVVAGGPAAPHFLGPDADPGAPVDCVVPGEGELTLVEMVQALDGGGREALGQVPGLLLRSGDGFTSTTTRAPLRDLDLLASPYAGELLRPCRIMLIEGARGCPCRCAFCSTPTHSGPVVRRFGREYLAADLARGVTLGVTEYFFIEPTLNLGTGRLVELRGIMEEVDPGGALGLFLEIDPDLLNSDQLEIIGGFPSRLNFGVGVQSMDPGVLRRQGCRTHPADLERNLRALAELGIVMVEIMLGLPGDTPDGFRRTLDFVLGLPASVIAFRTIVAPGTELWRRAGEFKLNYDPETFLLNSSPDFSAADLDRLEQETIAALAAASRSSEDRVTYYSASDVRMHQFGLSPPQGRGRRP